MMEAMKKPTISDNKVIAWLKLLPIPPNQLFAVVIQMESIGKNTENLQHGIEIGVGNTFRGPEASEHSIMIVRSVYVSITPC